MAKWADYCISTVKYSDDKTHIEKVRVHEDKGDKLESDKIWSRNHVISKIENSYTFITVYKRNEKWNKGEKVHVVVADDEKYLRTDKNETKKDNLGSLPEM